MSSEYTLWHNVYSNVIDKERKKVYNIYVYLKNDFNRGK